MPNYFEQQIYGALQKAQSVVYIHHFPELKKLLAFTIYLMQSIICTWFFYGYGFGWYNKLQFYELYYVVFAVWIFQLIFSSVWLKYFRFGPFEWLWRSLTYWQLQPMKR